MWLVLANGMLAVIKQGEILNELAWLELTSCAFAVTRRGVCFMWFLVPARNTWEQTWLLPAAWGQVRMEGKIAQVHEKTFGGDRYVHYFDCGDCSTDKFIVKTYQILNICSLLCVSYTPMTVKICLFLNEQLLHKISKLIIRFCHINEEFICNCSSLR